MIIKAILMALILLGPAASVQAVTSTNWFQDQEHYTTYYDYKYHANIVEFFIHECTGQRSISYRFGFMVSNISNSYETGILNIGDFASPFSDRNKFQEAAIEMRLIVTRDPSTPGGEGDPTHDAHREVLSIFNDFKDERDELCDFVFWDEVKQFEAAFDIFLEDTSSRYAGTDLLSEFKIQINESEQSIRRLFIANPL